MKIKIFISIILFFVLVSNSKEKTKDIVLLAQTTNPNQNWIESFNEFRTALYQNDKTKLKSFFKFPVMNENNEIWYVIEDEHQLGFAKGKLKPFTETDLNNYWFKIFDQYFINSLLKVKVHELFNKGEFETKLIPEQSISYKIYATYDKKTNQIILNFYTEEKYETGKRGEYEKAEFSKIYYFDILPNNKLQFKQIRLAG